VLLADGLFALTVESVCGNALHASVVRGGLLTSRKGVNFPSLTLNLPSLTAKDEKDLDFGIAQGVDVISLSFVRSAVDIRILKEHIASKGIRKPVIAKIEKPQAVANLEEILCEVDGVMVARGDLGVEMSPEKVPMLQKHIIEQCNRRGLPVITATQGEHDTRATAHAGGSERCGECNHRRNGCGDAFGGIGGGCVPGPGR
jgi:pyruvate kinase